MASLGRCSAGWMLSLIMALIVLCHGRPSDAAAAGYQNFTVGDDQGWTVPATKDAYQNWTLGKNFSLGDFLLFNYPSQTHNVIVTHNETVYRTCDWLDSEDDDIETWGQAGNSTYSAVPLMKTGVTYFICGAEPPEDHCLKGMKFAINVSHGLGLPPSLTVPPPTPVDDGSGTPADDSTPSGDDTPQFDQLPPPPPPPPSAAYIVSACIHAVLLLQVLVAAAIVA